MKRYVYAVATAGIYIAHLYRSCNYDEKRKGSPMKVGWAALPRFQSWEGAAAPTAPTVPASLAVR